LQAAFVRIAATVDPSVVLIQTTAGLGSGVVLDNQGDIVTNNHVAHELVAGMAPGQKVTVAITHPDGTTATVTVTIGQFPG
jgi:putative serine protease PepD